MAKKKIIVSGIDDKKTTPVKKINKGLVKKLIAVACIVAILVVGAVKVLAYTNSYIGTVDGIKLYVYEFEQKLAQVVSEMENEARDKLEEDENWDEVKREAFWAQVDENGKSNRTKAKEKALERLIEEKVKISEAKARGIYLDNRQKKEIIKMSEQDVEYLMQLYNSNYGMNFKSPNEFTTEMYNMTFAQYKEQEGIRWIVNKLDNIEKSKIKVSDDELKAWYEKNPDKYDTFVVKRIYISYEDKDGNLLEGYSLVEKQNLVAELEEKIKNGEDIGELAKEYTEKSSEKSTGGITKLTKNSEGEFSADVDEINEWMKEAKIGDWKKIEVKDSKDKVTEVYFVKYDKRVSLDNTEEDFKKEVREMRKTLESEVIQDKYEKMVKEDWMKKDQYKIVFNKNIYEKFKVVGMHA